MYIVGINAYHPDSSACIIKDGQLLAAAEEERFCRIKHFDYTSPVIGKRMMHRFSPSVE
jgi:predicted NodU family carbamoyl transferase